MIRVYGEMKVHVEDLRNSWQEIFLVHVILRDMVLTVWVCDREIVFRGPGCFISIVAEGLYLIDIWIV